MMGYYDSVVDGWDYPGVLVEDVGGGICWLSFSTTKCIGGGTEPAWQIVSDFTWVPWPEEQFSHTDMWQDSDGDWKILGYWGEPDSPPGTVPRARYGIETDFSAELHDFLGYLVNQTAFPIPPEQIEPSIGEVYLQPGPNTQSDSPEIISLADSLTSSSESELSAVRRIVDWCVDNLQTLPVDAIPPNGQSALEVLQDPSHLANCCGYTNLAVALLRSVGIPARFVAGIRLPVAYSIPIEGGGWDVFNSGTLLRRHAWVEVWYPETEWICYDAAWRLYQYVDTRCYRICSGVDSWEAYRDLRRHWFMSGDPQPLFAYRDSCGSHIEPPGENNSLSYVDTLATPCRFSLGFVSYDTGLEDDDNWGAPSVLSFAQSAPNPFSLSTSICVSVPVSGLQVILDIYDPSGHLVRSILSEELDVGSHTITWDGKDHENRQVASGVYLYKVRASGLIEQHSFCNFGSRVTRSSC